MESAGKPAEKVDIKSEIYRATVPYIIRLTKAAIARFRVLPKGDIFKNFVLMYLAVGFIIEGIAGALPAFALALLGITPGLVGFLFFLFWPIISFFILGGEEHTILSLLILFIAATYVTDLKQKRLDAEAALDGAPSRRLLTENFSRTSPFEATAGVVEIIPPNS